MLSTIPGSHITGENLDALAGLYQSYRSAEQTRREQGNIPRNASGDPWRGAHLIDPDRYNRKLARTFVEEILRPPPNATLVGFKEVRYYGQDDLEDYLDYMRATFQPCVFIFNRRDPAATAASARRKGHPNDTAEAVRGFDRRVDSYVALHRDDCAVVTYDEYVRDPQVLSPLFSRLGAQIDVARLRKLLSVELRH
jgi:hypothetical protein